MESSTRVVETCDLLAEAGFGAAAKGLAEKHDRLRRLTLAYEFYPVVREEDIEAFNGKLKANTERPATGADAHAAAARGDISWMYITKVADQLVFEAVEKYAGAPPADVLEKVIEAKGRKIFDNMEVASVQPVATAVKLPDPIVFGRINGCTDRFFIAEWGDDVKLVDLVGRNHADPAVVVQH